MIRRLDIRPALSFSGRAARPEFWTVVCVIAVAKIAMLLAAAGVHRALDLPPERLRWTVWPAMAASDVIVVWPLLALFVRRAHDRGSDGRSVAVALGLATILGLIPPWTLQDLPAGIGRMLPGLMWGWIGLVFFGLGLIPSAPGDNAYGPESTDVSRPAGDVRA